MSHHENGEEQTDRFIGRCNEGGVVKLEHIMHNQARSQTEDLANDSLPSVKNNNETKQVTSRQACLMPMIAKSSLS
jgi:hypothetical protein